MSSNRSWDLFGSKTAPIQPKKAPRELQESPRQPKKAPREPRGAIFVQAWKAEFVAIYGNRAILGHVRAGSEGRFCRYLR